MLRTSSVASPGADALRRSSHLAAKSKFRAATAELQARNVLLKKLGDESSQVLTGEDALAACRATFRGRLSAGKREAIRELFPNTDWAEEVLPLQAA